MCFARLGSQLHVRGPPPAARSATHPGRHGAVELHSAGSGFPGDVREARRLHVLVHAAGGRERVCRRWLGLGAGGRPRHRADRPFAARARSDVDRRPDFGCSKRCACSPGTARRDGRTSRRRSYAEYLPARRQSMPAGTCTVPTSTRGARASNTRSRTCTPALNGRPITIRCWRCASPSRLALLGRPMARAHGSRVHRRPVAARHRRPGRRPGEGCSPRSRRWTATPARRGSRSHGHARPWRPSCDR